MLMKPPSCLECERLFGRYLDAVIAWTQANQELAESSALSLETTKLSASAMDKRDFTLELCKRAGREYREHIQAAHGTVVS